MNSVCDIIMPQILYKNFVQKNLREEAFVLLPYIVIIL